MDKNVKIGQQNTVTKYINRMLIKPKLFRLTPKESPPYQIGRMPFY